MPQPVKLSDELVEDARVASDATERSIAGQVEFWARLGRALEPALRGDQVIALKRRGDQRSLRDLLESVSTAEGRARLDTVLAARPFPHFEAGEHGSGNVIKIDADGTRTVGRFEGRVFVAQTRAR